MRLCCVCIICMYMVCLLISYTELLELKNAVSGTVSNKILGIVFNITPTY